MHQDKVESVPAMLKMFEELSSPVKVKEALPNTGDHVIASYIRSKDLGSVQGAIENFMRSTLNIKKVKDVFTGKTKPG